MSSPTPPAPKKRLGPVAFLLQFFNSSHLPIVLPGRGAGDRGVEIMKAAHRANEAAVAQPFEHLAFSTAAFLPENAETTACIRKLLEAKDCAVRASFAKTETDG